ncbi:MAG: hypothetical protein ACREB7_11910 [Sphingopyxis sp.]|uniref:hypothetical protein n=1 Tax=Sphingopyxis sp. TaxID=1908224 RepID=UPI003D6D2C9A
MKYPILAAALLFAAAPATAFAMAVDDDERELYDSSIQCMTFYGLMAGLGSEDGAENPDLAKSGTKFLAVATVLADEDEALLKADFDKQMNKFALLTANPDDPDNIRQIKDIVEGCKSLETVIDAMLESGS